MAAPFATDDPPRAPAFDELVREGVSLIPAWAPDWTDHNPSDPGITLVELLAYFTEILAWRALRITPDAKLQLLRLLEGSGGRRGGEGGRGGQGDESREGGSGGEDAGEAGSGEGAEGRDGGEAGEGAASVAADPADRLYGQPPQAVDDALAACIHRLARPQCAVTPADFERLAVDAAAGVLGAGAVVRACCIAGWDLRPARSGDGPPLAAPADVTVMLAPERELPDDALDRLCERVRRALAPRCLLTMRVHVIGPMYLHVAVGGRVAPEPGLSFAEAMDAIDAALRRRFGPVLPGEPLADARPFGRPLHLSEVAEAIDDADGVDHVERLAVRRIGWRADADFDETLIGLRIRIVSRIGVDTRLGGRISRARRRLGAEAGGGEAESVALQPWELVRVTLAREAVTRVVDDGDDGLGLDLAVAAGAGDDG